MNTYYNTVISIGKRKALPPLELPAGMNDAFARAGAALPNANPQLESVKIEKSRPSLEKNQKPTSSVLRSAPEPGAIMLKKEVIDETKDAKNLPLHHKAKSIKEILLEAFMSERINLSKYRDLDDKQKSLLNKLLTYKYQQDILDLLDTGGVETLDTEEYLLYDPSEEAEKTLLFLRLKLLFETKIWKSKQHIHNSQLSSGHHLIAAHYFGSLVEQADFPTAGRMRSLFEEVDWIRKSAAAALANSEGPEWIKGMRAFLNDLIQVPSELVAVNHKNQLEHRLSWFLYDEDNDAGSFFPKLKLKLKEKKIKLPLTLQELKYWDQIVVSTLKSELSPINSYFGRQSKDTKVSKPRQSSMVERYLHQEKKSKQAQIHEESNLVAALEKNHTNLI